MLQSFTIFLVSLFSTTQTWNSTLFQLTLYLVSLYLEILAEEYFLCFLSALRVASFWKFLLKILQDSGETSCLKKASWNIQIVGVFDI